MADEIQSTSDPTIAPAMPTVPVQQDAHKNLTRFIPFFILITFVLFCGMLIFVNLFRKPTTKTISTIPIPVKSHIPLATPGQFAELVQVHPPKVCPPLTQSAQIQPIGVQEYSNIQAGEKHDFSDDVLNLNNLTITLGGTYPAITNVVITTPSGATILPNATPPGVSYSSSENQTPTFTIPHPENGEWKVTITNPVDSENDAIQADVLFYALSSQGLNLLTSPGYITPGTSDVNPNETVLLRTKLVHIDSNGRQSEIADTEKNAKVHVDFYETMSPTPTPPGTFGILPPAQQDINYNALPSYMGANQKIASFPLVDTGTECDGQQNDSTFATSFQFKQTGTYIGYITATLHGQTHTNLIHYSVK